MPSLHADFAIAPPRYTYEDYKKWSDEWELIDGYPYSLMPSAKFKHQIFNNRFSRMVGNLLADQLCNCEPVSEIDWIINDDTIVRPDTMIVCGKVTTDFITSPPSLVLEISSPFTSLKDKNIKYKLYETNSVKYYVMADTEKQKVTVYELLNGSYQIKSDSSFQFSADCKIAIDFSNMWYSQ
jgi:Uma2 family endonuclease